MRGIAALLVVWQHTTEYLLQATASNHLDSIARPIIQTIDPGRVGVICFFLISGFIIPSSLKHRHENALREFAIKRFFRLYPAYWLSILLAILVDTLILMQATPSPAQVIANATMAQNILGYTHIQGLYWTLQVELIFYGLCALLFHLNALHDTKKILLTIVICIAVFAIINAAGTKLHVINRFNKELFYTPFLLGVMLCGTLLRMWTNHSNRATLKLMLYGFVMVFSIPAVNWLLSFKGVALIADPSRFLISHLVGLGLFVAAITLWKKPPSPLKRLGVISYSIYLLHPIVMHALFPISSDRQFWSGTPDGLAFQIATSMLTTCLVSELIFRYIESPSNETATRLIQSMKLK